jgi:UDP-N-acetylmuramoyl-L-alanyl-D-glutamate--2,6-diaminopimelate ligase
MNTHTLRWRALQPVLAGIADVPADFEVSDLTLDSRAVHPGAAFLACRGRTHHGVEFAAAAAAAGARAILWEPAPGVSAPLVDAAILVRAVPSLSTQLGLIADRFFDAPSASLTVAGITGTNGKTTCAWLLAQALNLLGRQAAYIGTLGAGVPGPSGLDAGPAGPPVVPALTTPDAVQLQRLLSQLRERAFDAVALEVSSHALDQDRCAGLRIHSALFTNLTRDHLDYHGDMDAYGAAKAKLFDWPSLAVRVINIDDSFGRELAQRYARRGARAPVPELACAGALESGRRRLCARARGGIARHRPGARDRQLPRRRTAAEPADRRVQCRQPAQCAGGAAGLGHAAGGRLCGARALPGAAGAHAATGRRRAAAGAD